MSVSDEAADYVDEYERARESERIERHLRVFREAWEAMSLLATEKEAP